jgi:hypothetical protein
MFLINLGSYQIRDNLKFLINLGWMIYDKYENLDKVDIFCLGAAIYELIRGTPFPDSGPHFANIRGQNHITSKVPNAVSEFD